MPRLPVVEIGRRNLRALNQPEASARDFGAGIGSALTEAGNVFERIQEASDEAEYRRISEQTKAKMEGALKLLDEEQPDPNVYYSQAAGTIEELHKGAVASASNPRVKSAVESSLQPFITRSQTVANLDRHKKQVTLAKANSLTYRDQAKDRLIEANTPLEQQIIERDIVDHMRTMTASGAYKADEAVKIVQGLSDDVDKGRKQKEVTAAYSLAERNPKLLIEKLDAGVEFGLATGPERMALRSHANAALNAQERLIKEAQKERIDATNTNMLERNVAGRLSIPDVMASDLPFQDKRRWRNDLERQMKAKAGPKEIDPFAKSDGATRGMVMQGILSDPHEWPQDRIMEYHGKGLSTPHMMQAIAKQKELTKDPKENKKYAPLTMTMKTIDDMRRNYFFTDEGRKFGQDKPGIGTGDYPKLTDKNASPALKLKNDAEYNRIVDEVTRRHEAGEDPRAVLEQLTKPYFDDKVKSYFQQATEFFIQPLAPPTKALAPPAAPPARTTTAPPTSRNVETVQTKSGPIQINKNVSQQDRDKLIDAYGGLVTPGGPPMTVPRGEKPAMSLDDQARDFLMRNNREVNADTLKRTKEYLQKKGAR